MNVAIENRTDAKRVTEIKELLFSSNILSIEKIDDVDVKSDERKMIDLHSKFDVISLMMSLEGLTLNENSKEICITLNVDGKKVKITGACYFAAALDRLKNSI